MASVVIACHLQLIAHAVSHTVGYAAQSSEQCMLAMPGRVQDSGHLPRGIPTALFDIVPGGHPSPVGRPQQARGVDIPRYVQHITLPNGQAGWSIGLP